MGTPTNSDILTGQQDVGIIRQPNSSGAATAFACAGGTSLSWTNPAVASTNFRDLYLDVGTAIPDPDVTVDEYGAVSQPTVHHEYDRLYVDNTSTLPKIPFTGVMDKNTLAPILIGALQAVSEGAVTPYEKTITAGGLSGAINFANNGGYLHSIALDNSASANDGYILENAIVDNLTLDIDFNNKGVPRLGQMSGAFIGNLLDDTITHSGTWVSTTIAPFNDTSEWSASTFNVGAADYSGEGIKKFTLEINNNTESRTRTAGGKPNQFDIFPEITATVILGYNAVTENAVNLYRAGSRVNFVFTNAVADGTDGNLKFTIPYGVLIENPIMVDDPYYGVQLKFRAYAKSAATPITILLADALDWGY